MMVSTAEEEEEKLEKDGFQICKRAEIHPDCLIINKNKIGSSPD